MDPGNLSWFNGSAELGLIQRRIAPLEMGPHLQSLYQRRCYQRRLARLSKRGFILMRAKIVGVVAALLLAVSASSAQAAPISGSFSMTGNFLPLNSWDLFTSLDLATGLDFIALTGSESSPGTAGEFMVNSAKGDFASLVGQTGTIQDLT